MLCLLRRRGALLVSSSVAFLVAADGDAVLRLRLSDPRGYRSVLAPVCVSLVVLSGRRAGTGVRFVPA